MRYLFGDVVDLYDNDISIKQVNRTHVYVIDNNIWEYYCLEEKGMVLNDVLMNTYLNQYLEISWRWDLVESEAQRQN